MMSTSFGSNMPHMIPATYTNHPTLDDYFRQQQSVADSFRKISRHSTGPRAPSAMRVVKPRSANNSPQTTTARRRTMMNDNQARRRQQALDQALQHQIQNISCYAAGQDQVRRNSRPVSWHPSSQLSDTQQMHMQMPQVDLSQLATAMPVSYPAGECFTGYQNLPPTPAAYSGHTSPAPGFSPSIQPYCPQSHLNAVPAYVSEPWISTTQVAPNCLNQSGSPGAVEPFPAYNNQTLFDWHTYSPQGLQSCTAPPTPDECLGLHQLQTVPSEESIPFQPLEDRDGEEEEGEILVGMGLYDLPSKADTDPELDHYRMTASQLLDTTYRSGKGWKLEEAWEPPATDDEDTEEDADGEDSGDEPKGTESPPAQQSWI